MLRNSMRHTRRLGWHRTFDMDFFDRLRLDLEAQSMKRERIEDFLLLRWRMLGWRKDFPGIVIGVDSRTF